jgi:signal transduction histidine kinase
MAMPLPPTERDAIIFTMKFFTRATRLVSLVAILVLSLAGAFLWLHWTRPSDGARLLPGDQSAWRSDGVRITSIEDKPAGLHADDIVTAIDGQPLETYARALFDPSASHPVWQFGQTIYYSILRDGRAMVLPITLDTYPLSELLVHEWGTISFALITQLVATFVFLRRSHDPAARVLFLWASSIMSATTWSLGLQIGDLVNGIGFWLFKATTFGAFMLFYITGLHFALIFPQPFPLVLKHRSIIPLLYIVPYVSYAFYLAATWRGSVSVLAWIGQWVPGESVLTLIYLLLMVIAMILNYRASTGVARQKIRWMGFAALLSSGAGLFLWTLPGAILGYSLITSNTLGLLLLPFPLAIGIAILRHHLFDIDVIINRTLVYGALTFSTMALYAFIVGYIGNQLQASDRSLIAFLTTGLVAVLFQPLRERLQRAVNRLMYGERDDPYAVLSRLSQRLDNILAPDSVLPAIVETIAQALKLPYAAIQLKQGDEFKTVAAYGLATKDPVFLPIIYKAELIGQLILSPRARDEEFSSEDRHLLENLARQAGIAAYAVRLTADLQRSRERLVTAREEERRRIRRDLHDGLGPTLASLTLKAETARNLIPSNPHAADAMLADLTAQTQSAIADIRRLVYELRPPALDELGLVSAIRDQAAHYNLSGGLRVSVDAPENPLPALSAAIEVAAYRIAVEAMTNVARHARAQHCEIHITLNDALQIEITDDGVGISPSHPPGVGLTSMRERTAELGGTLQVEGVAQSGTRIVARLPLKQTA